LGTAPDYECNQAYQKGVYDKTYGMGNRSAETAQGIVGADPITRTFISFQDIVGCYNSGYNAASVAPTTPPSQPVTLPEQQIVGGSDFSGQACNSPAVIQMVQGAIQTTADGKWGPASQTALQKAGGTFQSYAPGCTGNPPSYGAITGGGGGGTVATTYAAPPNAMPATTSSGLLSKPIVWVGLAMAAVGGYVLLTGKKKGKKGKR
jgi:hypothetical protein